MHLSPDTEAALEKWLAPESWHTKHDSDMDRFYDFVSQYQKDHGYSIDESALRELIQSKARAEGNEALGEIIYDRICLAYNILDFLKRTGR